MQPPDAVRIVGRDDIVAALHVIASARIAPLAARAGYGKSTALRQFAATSSRSLIAYDVPYDVGTFGRFLRGLCDALAPVSTSPRLTFTGTFDRVRHSPDMHVRLAQWLHSHIDGLPIVLAVDELQHAKPFMPLVVDFFDAYAQHAGTGSVNVLLAARTLDDFPIPRWLANEYIAMPIETDRFAFTAHEATALANAFAVDANPEVIEDLLAATNGCVLAVVFALWHAQRRRTPLRSGDHDWNGDIDASIFDLLDARERELVERTMLLDALDAAALRSVDVDPQEFGALRATGAPVFDTNGAVLRYRSDFARYVADHVRRTSPLAFDDVLARTLTVLIERGHATRALELALRAGRRDEALALLEANATALLDDADIVEETLQRFGAADRPALMMLHGVIDARHGRLDTAEAWLTQAIDRAEDGQTRRDAAEALAVELMRSRRADAVEIIEAMLRNERDESDHRLFVLSMLAQALVIAERYDDARRTLQEALSLAPPQAAKDVAKIGSRLAFVCLHVGETERARYWAERASEAAQEARLYSYACGASSILYELAAADDRIADAMRCLHQLADAAMKSGNVEYHVYALAGMLDLSTERADFAELARCDHALRSFDVRYTEQHTTEGLLPGLAMRAAWNGNFDYAAELLGSSAERQGSPERVALRWAEIALYAAGAGDHNRRKRALDAARIVEALDAPREYEIAFRAAVLATFAAAAGERGAMRARKIRAAAGVAPNPRMAALASAVDTLVAGAAGGEVLAALDTLWAHDLGGYALVFAAFPAPAMSAA